MNKKNKFTKSSNKFAKFGKGMSRAKMNNVKGGEGNHYAYGHCNHKPNPNAADTPGWSHVTCP